MVRVMGKGLKIKPAELTPRERIAVATVIYRRCLDGETEQAVADDMEISRSTVSRYKRMALEALPKTTAEEAREELLDISRRLVEANLPAALMGDEKRASIVKFAMERWSKLTGSDKPIEIAAQVTEISQEERELQMLLEQTERDSKVQSAMRQEESAQQ